MRVLALMVMLYYAATVPANAQNAQVYGAGISSCASYLASSAREAEGNNWVLGFWSGANVKNAKNRMVGHGTDPLGILGEVKKICVEEPSLNLIAAVDRVYDRLLKAGK